MHQRNLAIFLNRDNDVVIYDGTNMRSDFIMHATCGGLNASQQAWMAQFFDKYPQPNSATIPRNPQGMYLHSKMVFLGKRVCFRRKIYRYY